MNNIESYPPVLRRRHHHPPPPHLDPEMDSDSDPIQDPDPIPVIDLEWLDKEKLDEACKEWGIFRLVNHGVPSTLLEELQELAKQVFSLSFESKQDACKGSPVTYFWGTPALSPSGTALSRGGPQNYVNLVEGFDVPLTQLSNFHPQLPTLQSIRLLLIEYKTHLSRIATTLLEAMLKNLNLNNLNASKSKSSDLLSEDTGMVRVYRYPDCRDLNDDGWGMGMEVHTDSSVLSILNQDDHVSGLQVLKDGQWITLKPISNTLVVNLGDMTQAMSNDRYKSVLHRVKVNKYKERISICYFVFPGEAVVIESSKYRPFTYNDFRAQVQQDVKTLGYKVGLPRFQRDS